MKIVKKIIALLACTVSVFPLASFAQRLPHLATPTNYKLTLAPDFSTESFTGAETIQIEVLQPTRQIVLNAADIKFEHASITSANATQTARVLENPEKQTAILAVENQILPGRATVEISYTGVLNNQLRGFYLGRDEEGNKYAVTQFEATDARRAFPSFDEPSYKATFDLTVTADKNLSIISNSKILTDAPDSSGAKHTLHFATTPKMSCYLLALAVGHFEFVEGSADGIPIRVWTTPGKKQLAGFALETAEHVLQYYDHYFAIKYPYTKLDLIALPDFSAGAMENTACITFREILLLLDQQRASLASKKRVASVIAHEMAHQWFGDLVTMQWWDDVWLNEGFATWMSSKPIQAWHPEWQVELNDVQETTQSLDLDSLENTRPIHQRAETPAQILELFDGIAYGKTAAVLRMLESYLGPDTFQAGVNLYLKEHAYGNATATDFWTALAQASKKPVDQIMPTFVEQSGVPMVSVSMKCAKNTEEVVLGQHLYFYDRARLAADKSDELWMIPVCFKGEGPSKEHSQCTLLQQQHQAVSFRGCTSWIYANRDARGYYRSSYTPADLAIMAKSVESSLSPAERMMLLTDAWASMRVGHITIGDYLTLVNGFHTEHNYAVINHLLVQLKYISQFLVTDEDRPAFNIWMRHLFAATAEQVGWEAKLGESGEQVELRGELLQALGTAQDPRALAEAKKLAEQYLDRPNSVQKELVVPALEVAASHGNEALYAKVMAHLKAAHDPEPHSLYSQILTEFTNPTLVKESLTYFISPEVRSQDVDLLIARELLNPAIQPEAWNFIQAHWNDIQGTGGAFLSGRIVQASGRFCSPELRDSMLNFFAEHKTSAQRALKQSEERINYCIDLKSQQQGALTSWLEQRHSFSGE